MTSCDSLENVDGLSCCTALKQVDLSGRGVWEPDYQQYMRDKHSLQSIEGLLELQHLEKVNLSNQTLIPEPQIKQLLSKKIKVELKGYTDP